MDFQRVDTVLAAWLPPHGLHVLTQYRDDEVRVVPIVDDQGCQYSLWFDPQGTDFLVRVDANPLSRNPERTWSALVPPEKLSDGLDDAWHRVEQWIAEDGHSRIPYL